MLTRITWIYTTKQTNVDTLKIVKLLTNEHRTYISQLVDWAFVVDHQKILCKVMIFFTFIIIVNGHLFFTNCRFISYLWYKDMRNFYLTSHLESVILSSTFHSFHFYLALSPFATITSFTHLIILLCYLRSLVQYWKVYCHFSNPAEYILPSTMKASQ